MRPRVLYTILVVLLLVLQVAPNCSAVSPITLTLMEPDVSQFPEVKVVVRAYDARGFVVPQLEGGFTVREVTELGSSNPIRPSVIASERGERMAVSLVLDTRNGTSREELNAARDTVRGIVVSMKPLSGGSAPDADLMELWVPGLADAPVVPFGRDDPVTLINAINTVLPNPGTSAGLDGLLRQIISNDTSGSMPHIVVVVGKIAGVNPALTAATLAGLAQQRRVLIYTAPIGDDSDYLTSLALPTGGLSVRPDVTGTTQIVTDLRARYKLQYELKYVSVLTPTAQGRRLIISVDSPAGKTEVERTYRITAITVPLAGTYAAATLVAVLAIGILGIGALFGAGLRLRLRRK